MEEGVPKHFSVKGVGISLAKFPEWIRFWGLK